MSETPKREPLTISIIRAEPAGIGLGAAAVARARRAQRVAERVVELDFAVGTLFVPSFA